MEYKNMFCVNQVCLPELLLSTINCYSYAIGKLSIIAFHLGLLVFNMPRFSCELAEEMRETTGTEETALKTTFRVHSAFPHMLM